MHLTHGFWPGRPVTAADEPASHRLDAWDRLAYLGEICELLWPSSGPVTLDSPGRGWFQRNGAAHPGNPGEAYQEGTEFILMPGPSHPRLLVPTAAGASAAAMRHYGQPRSATARAVQRSLALGLACGLGGKVLGVRVRVNTTPDADGIEAYLQRALGRDFRMSVRLGPARANRKPVLELVTRAGEPVGFAKIGFNPLTRNLVRAERAALDWLNHAGLSGMTAPRVVHHGQWHELEVLVVSALPVWQRWRPVTAERLCAAMDSVGRLGGLRRGPRPAEAYLQNLRVRLSGAGESPERQALQHALDALTTRVRGADLTFGAWHGDWTPWNMASTERGLLVWDWERFTVGAPFGFDALHYWLRKEVVQGHRDPREAAAGCLARAGQLLAPFGAQAAEARITAALYLADLAIRYLADRQSEAGARFGATGAWLIPALTAEVARQSASQNGSG
jgi:hypothetical protein